MFLPMHPIRSIKQVGFLIKSKMIIFRVFVFSCESKKNPFAIAQINRKVNQGIYLPFTNAVQKYKN